MTVGAGSFPPFTLGLFGMGQFFVSCFESLVAYVTELVPGLPYKVWPRPDMGVMAPVTIQQPVSYRVM